MMITPTSDGYLGSWSPASVGLHQSEVVLQDPGRGFVWGHVEDDQDGELGAGVGCVVGRLAQVLVGCLYCDGGLPGDLQLGVDPVVDDVEESSGCPGCLVDPAFQGGVGEQAVEQVVVEGPLGYACSLPVCSARTACRRPCRR